MKKRDEYLELQKRHQKELEDFPIAYAFNDKQLEEALEKLGATKEEWRRRRLSLFQPNVR